MKWPFVARSLHDEIVADLRARLDASDIERRKLTRTIVKMKVSGGSIPRAVETGRLEQRKRDDIEKAVDDNPHFRANPRLGRRQITWARQSIEDGQDRAAVIEEIKNFGSVVEHDDYGDGEEDEVIPD